MRKKNVTALLCAGAMFLLIMDAQTAISGASEGLSLCIRAVVPSLLPLCVLSAMLTSVLVDAKYSLFRPICRSCRIPISASGLLIAGTLGGYPVGAQSVANLYRSEQLDRESAKRALMFCSNAGPAFIFGIVAANFTDPHTGWLLWGIHILSAWIVGALLPGKVPHEHTTSASQSLSITDALRQSIRTLSQVCGWVILFRVLCTFLDKWFLHALSIHWKVLLTGLLELTNGCCQLSQIQSEALRLVVASGMLAFGGVCVVMQTASVTGSLGVASYIRGKLIQTVLSISLAIGCLIGILPAILLSAVAGILLWKMKNKCGNSAAVGV